MSSPEKITPITVGCRVRLTALPSFVKTADPMPMLRPPTVLTLGEEGLVLERRSPNTWAVRFEHQAYLIDSTLLEVTAPSPWTTP